MSENFSRWWKLFEPVLYYRTGFFVLHSKKFVEYLQIGTQKICNKHENKAYRHENWQNTHENKQYLPKVLSNFEYCDRLIKQIFSN